jgi:hypothetical protein
MEITLITGASSGLGHELAKIYVQQGHNLLLNGTSKEKLEKVKEELLKINNKVIIDTFPCDLSQIDEVKKLTTYIKEKDYFVSYLINNAGIGDCTDFVDMDIEKQMTLNNININALVYLTRDLVTNMVKNNQGHIVNIASIAGFTPGPYMCTYHASKAYVLIFSESIAYELRKTKVKVTCICPGPFTSNFVAKAHNDYTFSKMKPASAQSIAQYTYKMAQKGKVIAIPGLKNKITTFAPRFASRKFVRKEAAKTIKKI